MNDSAGAMKPQGSNRSTWLTSTIGAIGAIVLVVIVVAAVALTTTQEDAIYPPDSAEAALQDYYGAWQSGDTDAAYAALSTRAQARVPRDEFRHAQTWQAEKRVRVWIDVRTDRGDRVVLRLTVEETYEGFLRPSRDTSPRRITLIREDGTWKIDTPLVGYYPW